MSNKIKLLAGALMILGLLGTGVSSASECLSDNATYSASIGAQTTCSDFNGQNSGGQNGLPMDGCVIGSGSTSCEYYGTNCAFKVVVGNGGVGQVDPTSYTVEPILGYDLCQAKIAITQGNQGANFCQYTYPGGIPGAGDTLTTLGNQNKTVSHKQLEVCADELVVTGAAPVLSIEKTVVRIVDGTFDCDDATDSVNALAPTEVAFCYTIDNIGQGTVENLILEDTLIGLNVDLGTPLQSEYPIMENSGPVLISGTACDPNSAIPCVEAAGAELVNTATVSGSFGGGACDTCEDSDTASVLLLAENCPANFQGAVNQFAAETGLDYAFLLDPNQGGRLSVCAPDGNFTDPATNYSNEAIRVQCVDQCITKEICETDPTNVACSPSVCESSGAWTEWSSGTSCSVVTDPAPGVTPYCFEVQQDLNKDCVLNEWDPQDDTVLHIKKGHSNPYVYQSCYSSGGRYVCETMCFAYSTADRANCPPGSTIF